MSCSNTSKKLSYPETTIITEKKTYHNQELVDNYSWLSNNSSQEVKHWAKKQDSFMESYVKEWDGYKNMREKVSNLMVVKGRMQLPTIANNQLYYTKSDDQGNWNLFVKNKNAEKSLITSKFDFDVKRVLFYIPSPDGKYLALGIASKTFYWKILDLQAGKLLDQKLEGTNLNHTRLVWNKNSRSFFYTSYTQATDTKKLLSLTVKHHSIEKPHIKDKLVFTAKHDSKIELSISDDNVFLVLTERTGNDINAEINLIRTDLTTKKKALIKSPPASFIYIGNNESHYFFETDYKAPRGKIISIDIRKPDPKYWKTIVPESQKAIMGYQSAGGSLLPLMVDNKIVIPYQKNLVQSLSVYNLNGQFKREIELPKGGLYFNRNGYNAFSGNRMGNKLLTRCIGITEPNTIFEIDINSGIITPFSRASTNFNPDNYKTEIVFSTSKDGTVVPISLTYKRGLIKSKSNPVIVQVYGAIAFTNYPYFQGDYTSWLNEGGIHAVAHVRGGGANGSSWHKGGIGKNKQNGIDDYLSSLEWLISNGYTSNERLVVNGVSAGCIIAAAAIVQRPKLIGAGIFHYGMFDMISSSNPIFGESFLTEIGNINEEKDFLAMNSYSPYQNLDASICYPPILALTSNQDDPINSDSYKLVAALQNLNSTCENPYLLQIAWNSSHATFGSEIHSPIDTFTDELAFLYKTLKLNPKNN